MYRINPLNRPVLIMVDEVVFHCSSDANPDTRKILTSIINAEERFIANIIGDEFYEAFIERKNIEVTDANKDDLLTKINASLALHQAPSITLDDIPKGTIINAIELIDDEDGGDWMKKLWNRHLWKLTAECVDMMTIVPSWLRHAASGQQMNNPKVIGGNEGGSASGDMKDIKFKMDIMLQDRINPLIERMELWLWKNKDEFPLYKKTMDGCSENDTVAPDGISAKGKTDFVLGIYDND